MKGIIFNLAESFISHRFSDNFLEDVYENSGLSKDVPPFLGPVSYPDEEFISMLKYVSQEKDIEISQLLYEFGIYSIPVLAERYPVFFENNISSYEFITNINDIHHIELHKLYPDANPPVFVLEETDDNRLIINYSSKRKLCNLAKGLVIGVGNHYEEKIDISKKQCMVDGGEKCVFEITISQG